MIVYLMEDEIEELTINMLRSNAIQMRNPLIF